RCSFPSSIGVPRERLPDVYCYTQRHKCETKLPSLDKEGRRWRKPARGGWNPRGTHHPSHGLRPWHPLLSRGGEYFVVALTSRIYVALYSLLSHHACPVPSWTRVSPDASQAVRIRQRFRSD